jgi:hypothetical protein
MKANDVILFAVSGDGPDGEQYEVSKVLSVAENGDLVLDTPLTEQVRVKAFDAAHAIASGRDVFFTQQGRPFYLQDFYNYVACNSCGMMINKFDTTTYEHAPNSPKLNCPACGFVIEAPAIIWRWDGIEPPTASVTGSRISDMNTASGRGRVLDKTSGHELAAVDYTLRIVPPPPGRVLRSIDLHVEMPWRIGMESQRENRSLVLETAEGKYVDFFVTGVSQDGITVTASGGPRDTLW